MLHCFVSWSLKMYNILKKWSSLWWHKALQLGLTWRDEAKSLAICHTLRELLIISALDNKCTLVRTRTKLKIHDYLQLRTELRGGRNGQKVGVQCFSSFRVLHPIYFKTRPTALSWKIDYLKLKILQLPDKNHNLGSLKQSPGWGSFGRFAQHLIW